jgi:hypothetical protein
LAACQLRVRQQLSPAEHCPDGIMVYYWRQQIEQSGRVGDFQNLGRRDDPHLAAAHSAKIDVHQQSLLGG